MCVTREVGDGLHRRQYALDTLGNIASIRVL